MHLHSSLLVAYLALVVGLGFGLLAVRAPRPVRLRLMRAARRWCARRDWSARCSSSPACPPRWSPCTSQERPRARQRPRRYGRRCENGPSPSRSSADSTPSANSRCCRGAVGLAELTPAQRRLDQFQLEQPRIVRSADDVDAGVEELRRRDAEVVGRGGQRGVADVPQLEVRLGGPQRLLGVRAGVVERGASFPAAAGSAPW